MIHKTFITNNGKSAARVTFILPNSIWADIIYLVGDFNHWNCSSHPFQRDREGRWILTVDLELGQAYQFRYLRDDQGWMHEYQADDYVYNPSGSDNFVVVTEPNFKHYFY